MEQTKVNLTLPYPPSANRYWRSVVNKKTGHVMIFVSQEAKKYKKDVALLAGHYKPLAGELIATFRFYRPRCVGDLSNRIKVLEDAMQGFIYIDDAQITEIHAYKFDSPKNPRVEVEITQILAVQDLFAVAELEEIPR